MLLLDGDEIDAGVLPLKSTGLTPSKKLMRIVDGQIMKTPSGKTFKPPTFAKVYSITSFLDKQKSGAQNTFMNVRFSLVGDVQDEMTYAAAKAFYESIKGGTAKLDDSAEGATGSDTSNSATTPGDDDVPF